MTEAIATSSACVLSAVVLAMGLIAIALREKR